MEGNMYYDEDKDNEEKDYMEYDDYDYHYDSVKDNYICGLCSGCTHWYGGSYGCDQGFDRDDIDGGGYCPGVD